MTFGMATQVLLRVHFRVPAAPPVQLDTWLDGIFDAGSLTDLLGPESPPPAH